MSGKVTFGGGDQPALPGHRRSIVQIQWLRGIAATLVMLFHSGEHYNPRLHQSFIIFPLAFGYLGVALFFAISGYLMSIAVRVQTPAVFLAHRVIRIYPLLIIITLAVGLGSARLWDDRPIDLRTLALMPLPGLKPCLFIAWTLIFEVAFYVCLYLIGSIGCARYIYRIALIWLAVIAGISIASPYQDARLFMPVYQLLTVPVSLPMAGGLLLPWLLQKRIPPWLPLTLGILPWFLAPHYALEYNASRLLFGVSAVFLLWGFIAIPEQSSVLRLGLLGRILGRWGDYSYGLYLCHVTILQLTYRLCSDRPFWQVWCIGVFGTCLVAVVAGQFDVSLYSRLKGIMRRTNPAVLQRLTASFAFVYIAVSLYGAEQYFVLDRDVREGMTGAMQLRHYGPIGNAHEANEAARQLGWREDPDIAGSIDAIRLDSRQNHLYVDLWAVDSPAAELHLHVALFRDGQFLGVEVASTIRKDIAQTLKLRHRIKAGFHFERVEETCDPHPIVAVAFTKEGQYRILPNPIAPIVCPVSAGQRAP